MRYGLCLKQQDWLFFSIYRFIAEGLYRSDWGATMIATISD
ncbi:hypothetical protein MYAER_3727 [Microcystis aeruginosa NIES-2549]|uniref:Uncharacterized protein n=1 Tax=Microcystis aeruginosa NIES-2549 TaxID=1641812 RepID=A0A0F6U762_MICAE|nr:hypothetical protein MYAER_3727 [Microcystis aeruginosa NIES-2549]AOC54469.1 hypothetical protein amyaer_3774 [Microcystis aeruginosa NIES-2481]